MLIISYILTLATIQSAVIARNYYDGTLANGGKKDFATVVSSMISYISDGGNAKAGNNNLATVLCLIISNTLTLANIHP